MLHPPKIAAKMLGKSIRYGRPGRETALKHHARFGLAGATACIRMKRQEKRIAEFFLTGGIR
jgi:hypothetical protein